ncbi:MAG: helix-turn-helix transcriptional regulator [Thermodesulfobacteriota bacterium]
MSGKISIRLKDVRKELGYTQKQIGEAIGSSLSTWQDYEAGKSIPGGNALAGLARLGVDINWLLTGEGNSLVQKSEFDVELLKNVIFVLDNLLSNTDRNNELNMSLEKKSKWISYFYDEFMQKTVKERTIENIKDKLYRFLELSE